MSAPQSLEIRIAHLEGAYEQLDKRVGDLAAVVRDGFAQIDDRFSQFQNQMDTRFQNTDCKIDGAVWRMTSLILAAWSTTILAILLKH